MAIEVHPSGFILEKIQQLEFPEFCHVFDGEFIIIFIGSRISSVCSIFL